jgi:hypothetical protein
MKKTLFPIRESHCKKRREDEAKTELNRKIRNTISLKYIQKPAHVYTLSKTFR